MVRLTQQDEVGIRPSSVIRHRRVIARRSRIGSPDVRDLRVGNRLTLDKDDDGGLAAWKVAGGPGEGIERALGSYPWSRGPGPDDAMTQVWQPTPRRRSDRPNRDKADREAPGPGALRRDGWVQDPRLAAEPVARCRHQRGPGWACPPAGAVGGLPQYRRHQPGFGPACFGAVACLLGLIHPPTGMPSCVAKRVTKPIRNREARVTEPHVA